MRWLPKASAVVAAAVALEAASASLAAPPEPARPLGRVPTNADARKQAAPRLFSTAPTTWIWTEPKRAPKGELGYVRVGRSVALREPEPRPGPGCPSGFYAVEPYGWICRDRTVSLDASDRYVRASALAAPRKALLPFGYALSNGAPMYRRLPTRAEWEKEERWLGPAGSFGALSWGNKGHELLAEVRAIPPADPMPFFLLNGGSAASERPLGLVRRQIPLGSMLAFSRAFTHEGRTFLLSADMTVVPADRVRPYRESSFAGIELGKDRALPLFWIKKTAKPKYRRGADGSFHDTGQTWPARTAVDLDPGIEPVEQGKKYLATKERAADGAPIFVAERDAAVVRAREELPFSVTDTDKWIIVSITQGTLVAYQGKQPLFTTLVSPGAGGVPIAGKDPVKMSTTPLGVFRIAFKHRAATMSPEQGEDRSFWIADVPHTQYFNAPFALHTAYWHENFGEPMSAGCINLSPKDGAWLFDWTEPRVPTDWNGSATARLNGKGSIVVVTR
jgi:lipoprotein-anchoring transpeptidase ErfK/SrfK